MSKHNTELATKIVDKLGTIEETDAAGAKAWVFKYPPFGIHHPIVTWKEDKEMGPIAQDVTKKEARQRAIDFLASELDEGNIVLSDTWAEDNLK